jgi:hypothetical protein
MNYSAAIQAAKVNDLAQKWDNLARKNRLLQSAINNQDFGILPSRRAESLQAYRAFWDTDGAIEYVEAIANVTR